MRRMHNAQKNLITYVGVSRKFDYENGRARNGEILEERMRKHCRTILDTLYAVFLFLINRISVTIVMH